MTSADARHLIYVDVTALIAAANSSLWPQIAEHVGFTTTNVCKQELEEISLCELWENSSIRLGIPLYDLGEPLPRDGCGSRGWAEVILEDDIDYWVEGGKTDLKP